AGVLLPAAALACFSAMKPALVVAGGAGVAVAVGAVETEGGKGEAQVESREDGDGEEETEEDRAAELAVEAKFGKSIADLERQYEGKLAEAPESVRMLIDIAHGSQMGPGEGWFGPGVSKYSFGWLTERFGEPELERLSGEQIPGPAHWLARLDRNRDGEVTADDLDWSDRNPWVQRAGMINRFFRRMDPNMDAVLTKAEWGAFYDKLAGDRAGIEPDDLVGALLAGMGGGFSPGDEPSRTVLLRGLVAGEIGSLQEGPRVGEIAPEFALKTHDGQRTVRLAELLGKRPIVLTFGNFTCGPFRTLYPGVEAVYRRLGREATFVSIYVREAHPTDGWKMESNDRAGVAVAQPKTYGDRVAVASQCQGLLKCSMPLLVDEIDDRTGNAYSGMPARLYVLDQAGKVVYKSGRGPFGFKPGEMEQALVMCLLEQQLASPAAR
ncbi:MAG: deiodinase family protein, partial [Planctomycetaceae bacterium]